LANGKTIPNTFAQYVSGQLSVGNLELPERSTVLRRIEIANPDAAACGAGGE